MDINHDELYGGSSLDMRLDVKLAFNRFCSLIDSLKSDVGPEAASSVKKRIHNDLAKVLKIEKQRKLMQKNELYNASILETTAATAGNHHKEQNIEFPVNQIRKQPSKPNLQTINGNASFCSNGYGKMHTSFSSGFRPVGCSNEEIREQPSRRILQTNNENGSFFINDNEKMYTSFTSGSRPVGHSTKEIREQPSKHYLQTSNRNASFFSNNNDKMYSSFLSGSRPLNRISEEQHESVQLGTIVVEEETFGVGTGRDSSDSEDQEKESSEDGAYFFLRDWSILKKHENLVLTGIKLDKKGEIIKKDFVSEKILSRKDDDTVKTAAGELVLQGELVDPKNLIPAEVKAELAKSTGFPRMWRKILQQWIELDKQKLKGRKSVQERKGKSPIDSKSKDNENTKGRKNVQERKGKSPIDSKSKDNENTKGRKNVQERKGKSPIDSKSKDNENTKGRKNVQERKGKSPIDTKSKDNENTKGRKNVQERKGKSPIDSKSKDNENTETKKNKEDLKLKKKINKKPAKSHDLQNVNNKDFINDEGKDDRGPFSELLGDESLFLLPQSSMTPNGLLSSIKKNVIQGRYTPPTNMFDNVYGNKSDNNSSVNTSFDDLGAVVVNNHVAKRMAKVNTKKHTKKNNKILKPNIDENETINEILRAAKAKTITTPSILKQAFNTNEPEEFSDVESD